MSFRWPAMLVALLAAPLLAAGYAATARARSARLAELAAQGFSPSAALLRLRRRRHVPAALLLAAVTLLLAAAARPEMTLRIPRREGQVLLAFDVSSSMAAGDLAPSRIEAAKAAARVFVDRQPRAVEVGVVAFSDGGLLTQAPTTVRAEALAAIDRLGAFGGTSLGQGIFTALGAIAERPLVAEGAPLPESLEELDIGYHGSSVIVLLSDGENQGGPDPLEAARLASSAGVRIFTVGVGEPGGTVVEIDGFSVATALDEELLTAIAEVTDGRYYPARDADALSEVYRTIELRFAAEPERVEVTAVAAGAGLVLVTVAAGLSLVWFGRLV